MWTAISYVSSGVILVAFLAAVGAWLYRSKMVQLESLIGSAAEADRAQLVANALEVFHVDSSGLTKAQQYQLALEQIRARQERYRLIAVVIIIVSILAAAVAVFAIVNGSESDNGATPEGLAEARPLTLELRVHNELMKEVSIEPLSEFYVTESSGPMIHGYPKGRAHLTPVGRSVVSGHSISNGAVGRFTVIIPRLYSTLLDRGAANIHFAIRLQGETAFFMGSGPFHREYFQGNSFLDITIEESPAHGPKHGTPTI